MLAEAAELEHKQSKAGFGADLPAAVGPDMPPAAKHVTFEGQASALGAARAACAAAARVRWQRGVQQVTFEVRGTEHRDALAAKR